MRSIAALVISILVLVFASPVLALNIGIGSYINSAGVDANQQSLADLLGETGSNWTRMEIPYDLLYEFALLDKAVDKSAEKGSKILLLFAHKDGLTTDQFDFWVDTVANRYKGKIAAYEIFNEIDNTLSASAYKPFLEKAYNKIKAIDSSATVVASGLTGRKEAIDYWNALYDAGGGKFFDVLGVHPYRTSSPETKEFNNGSMVDSINQAVVAINAHGGGKKVWLTEFGWQSSAVGESSQGNLLARGYLLSATVAEVDNIIGYRLADNDINTTFGIAKSDFNKKGSFGSVQTVIGKLKGASFSERVNAVAVKKIDNFDGVSGWKDEGSSSGSVSLSTSSGKDGGGMKFSWSFSSGTGYVIAKKQTALDGEPKGLALWINGDNQTSVWKLRIEDKNKETFQFDLGQAPSGWKQYTFDFANDKAKTSWGGDGKVDYPIKFDSVVLDNQGGSTSGSVTIDEVEAWYGDTDLYAFRFGSLLAYWKSSGQATATVCGQELTFTTAPKYTSVSASSCAASATASSDSGAATTSSTSSTTQTTSTAKLDPKKSSITVDKSTAKVGETLAFKIFLKDTDDKIFQSSKITVTVSGSDNTLSKPVFVTDHYEFTLASTKAEEKEIKVFVGKTEVSTARVTFEESVALVESVAAPTVEEVVVEQPKPQKQSIPVVPVAVGGGAAAAVGIGLAAWKKGLLAKLLIRG